MYKRQALDRSDIDFQDRQCIVYGKGRKAVSYTHLDVYKRQDPEEGLPWNEAGR